MLKYFTLSTTTVNLGGFAGGHSRLDHREIFQCLMKQYCARPAENNAAYQGTGERVPREGEGERRGPTENACERSTLPRFAGAAWCVSRRPSRPKSRRPAPGGLQTQPRCTYTSLHILPSQIVSFLMSLGTAVLQPLRGRGPMDPLSRRSESIRRSTASGGTYFSLWCVCVGAQT